MADFVLVLGKLNLAMGAAIILVWLLRRPLRAQFGAPIAYALWLLVPVAGLAILLPPRTEAPLPVHVASVQQTAVRNLPVQYPAAQIPVTTPVAQPAPRVPAQPAERMAPVPSMIAAQTASLDTAVFDDAALLFAGWALGALLMALYLAQLQARFHATMRLGEAGPAVLGFFRPRVVMPDSFEEQFTAPEQAAILAHERVHLARQDARINALAALLRCLCWFNPLVHLGAAWLRMDQELACDATALAGPVSRRDYANALLKSQMMTTLLPLGCNWPGSQHPLIERIELLKRKRPGTARRMTGAGLVVVAATFAGLSAWAAQPAVPAKSVAAPSIQIALAVPAVRNIAANQKAGAPPVADANPVAGDVAKTAAAPQASKNDIAASGSVSAAPVESGEANDVGQKLATAVNSRLASELRQINNLWNLENFALKPINPEETQVAATTPAVAVTGKAPRPQTEAAMKCLNGLGPDGCETLFEESFLARRAIRYCAAEFVHDRLGNCQAGALETLGYLGANADGDDVFSTQNQEETDTYVIPPPGPDGKIAWWCVSGRPPESTFKPNCTDRHRTDSSAVRVITRPDSALILYVRPRDHAALQSPDGAFIPAAAGVTGAVTQKVSSQALQVAPDQHITWVGAGAILLPRDDVRPEVAQPLQQAVQLAKAAHPDPAAVIEKFNQAAAVPNLNRDEESTLGKARTIIFGARPNNNNSSNNNSRNNDRPWYGTNDLLSPQSQTPTMGPGPWTPN